MLGATGSVLRFEVVELAARNDLDDRQCLHVIVTKNRTGELGAADEGLGQSLISNTFCTASATSAAPFTMYTPSALPSVAAFTTQFSPTWATISSAV